MSSIMSEEELKEYFEYAKYFKGFNLSLSEFHMIRAMKAGLFDEIIKQTLKARWLR